MLIRQKVILALIDQMGGGVSHLSLVKMAFLLGKEYEIQDLLSICSLPLWPLFLLRFIMN